MFRGITALNLDTKGRLAIPTRYREALQEECDGQVVLTIDTESACLLLYPVTEWEVIEKKLEALPSFNRAARRIQRLLIGHATDLEMDSHGRLLVPTLLREYGSFDKKVMLVGQGKKFEMWSEDLWLKERETWLGEEVNTDELPDEMLSLSI